MSRIITIGRQYASGGSEIAKKLSEIMNIPCYDRQALANIALEHGIPQETFEKADEQATSSFLYSLAMSSYSGNIVHYGMNDNILTDRVFNIQSAEMKKIAEKSDCIIVGRCADDVLASFPHVLKVFIHSPIDHRIKMLMSRNDVDESTAKKMISKADKKRASYYNFYTGKGWGDPKNYHINIDSSVLGIDGTAMLIKCMADKLFE